MLLVKKTTARDELIRGLATLYTQVPEDVATDMARRFADYDCQVRALERAARGFLLARALADPQVHTQATADLWKALNDMGSL